MKIVQFTLKSTKVTGILFFLYLGYFCLNSSQFIVSAQIETYNPLESTEPDPLLPPTERARPFSKIEKRVIKRTTTALDSQAQAQLALGNKDEAFTLWYRELRLQRALGTIEEVNALGRVGKIAWQQNLTQDLNIISDRLLAIEELATVENTLSPELLISLGNAYQQVKALDCAVIIYQQILQNNRQEDNQQKEEKTLETLGKLHLARFDYTSAATVYEELLKFVRSQNSTESSNIDNYVADRQPKHNNLREEFYLTQLVTIYDKSSQPAQAIVIKQQLLKKYLANKKNEQLAALKLSLAKDYQALKQPKQARKYYEEAFNLAWSLQQFALAEDSLQKLALLYQEYQKPTAALKIYQELIKVEKQAYNYYNLMNTYDRIGQIHSQLNNHQQALIAYKKGLDLAKSLSYRVDYFQNKIEQLKSN